jgi:hypothetical protein
VRGRRAYPRLRRILAPLGVGMIVMFPAHLGPAVVPSPQASPPAIPSGARLTSDRTYKIDLVQKMKEPPRLLIFGGSRATRFDPSYFKRLTGLPTFNFAFSNGRPVDDWAITRWYLSQHPDLPLHVFWAVEPSLFFQKDLDPGLVQDARLTAAFPQKVADKAARKQVAGMGQPRVMLCEGSGFRADGMLTYGWYDYREQQGLTLDRAVRNWAVSVQTNPRSNANRIFTRHSWTLNQTSFVQTIALLNSVGCTPVVVVMPTQPLAIQLLGEEHWAHNLTRFLGNLRQLQTRYRFAVLDYSRVEDFGGDPSAFYDGVHVKAKNAKLIAARAFEDVPQAFR